MATPIIQIVNGSVNLSCTVQDDADVAIVYANITLPDGTKKWGVGMDTDIIVASIKGVLSALNRIV